MGWRAFATIPEQDARFVTDLLQASWNCFFLASKLSIKCWSMSALWTSQSQRSCQSSLPALRNFLDIMDTFSFASDLWDDFHWDVTTDTSMDGSFEVLPDLPGFGQGDADGQDFNSSFLVPDNGQWFTNSPLDIVTTKAAPSFPIDDIILGDAFLGPIFPVPSEAAGGQQLAATDLTLWHSPMANEGLTEDHIVRSSLQHTPYRIGHQDIRTMNPGPPEQAVEPLRPSRAKRARSPETATCDRASKKLQFTTCEKRLQDEQVQIQPGMFCFNANPDVPVPLVVERLYLERKKEIKEMRSVGACLSCKMQKKSVSTKQPHSWPAH
jgi:hypothetical protein